jgi:hypothetical protein
LNKSSKELNDELLVCKKLIAHFDSKISSNMDSYLKGRTAF